MNDLLALKTMDSKSEMTPYENYMMTHKESKKPSGVAIAGLTVGVVGAVAGVTAWIFGGMQAAAKGNQAKEVAIAAKELASTQYTAALQLMTAQNNDTKANIDRLLLGLQRETDARVNGDTTISQTITDTISGQQSGSQSATQSQTTAIDQTMQQIMTQTLEDRISGRSSLNPTPVMIYSAPQPCACPGCGCNG